jgi:hypothetical protein
VYVRITGSPLVTPLHDSIQQQTLAKRHHIELVCVIAMLSPTCVVHYAMQAPGITPKYIDPLTASMEKDARTQR